MKITDLKRNDVESALQYFVAEKRAGTWGSEKARALIRLQDDPKTLIALMQKHARGEK